MQRMTRMKKEMKLLEESPPHGISCWMKEDEIDHLEAQILGSEGTPYAGGVFKLDIQIPDRYPFEPPKIRFVTAIYHPNVDSAGRICLDSLKMPPKGAWKPALNVSTLLTTIQLLMAEPNPDDPLMTDIANEYKYNKPQFENNAIIWTKKYASQTPEQMNVGNESRVSENISSERHSTSVTSSKRSSDSIVEQSQPLQDSSNKKIKS